MIFFPKRLLILILLSLCGTSCAQNSVICRQPSNLTHSSDTQGRDRSSAYFQFLRGNHAEYNQLYNEAIEAYEMAYACDPDASLVLEKLVLMYMKVGNQKKATHYLHNLIEKDPDNLYRRLLFARLLAQQGDLDEAITIYLDILKTEPKNETALLQLGLVYSIKKQFDQAEAAFRSVLTNIQDSYPAHLYLAKLFAEKGQINDALHWYDKSLELNWSTELINEIIVFCTSHRQFDKLVQMYQLVLEKDPDNEMAGIGMVHSLLMQNKEDEAISKLSELSRTSQSPSKYNLILARYYFSRENYSRSETILNTILDKEDSSAANYMLGLTYMKQLKNTRALEQFQKLNPEDDEYQEATHLQVKLLQDMKRSGEAIHLLQQRIDDKKHLHPFYYLLLAAIYQDQGEDGLTLETLEIATQAFPKDERLFFELGLMYDEKDMKELAIKAMQQVLAINKQHPQALNYIGYTWADNNVHLQQALDYIQSAVSLLPDKSYIHDSLGWVYFRLGQLSKAREELEYAISLSPDDPYVYDHLGDVYKSLTLQNKALEAYRKALNLFDEKEKKEAMQNKINATNKP